MSINYSPEFVEPSIVGSRKSAITRIDISTEDVPLFDDLKDFFEDLYQSQSIMEGTNYSPNFSNFSSPIASKSNVTDNTDLSKPAPDSDSILDMGTENDDNPEPSIIGEPDKIEHKMEDYVPDSIIDYYHESAYGIPYLRQFPLTSRKDVIEAIHSIPHITNSRSRTTLIESIEKIAPKYDISFQKSTPTPIFESSYTIYGFEKPMEQRTRTEVSKDHLRMNNLFYNNVFYNPEYKKSILAMREFDFLDIFFPSFKRHSFYTRLCSSLGGLALCPEIYKELKIQSPIEENRKTETFQQAPELNKENFKILIETHYAPESNWFHVDLSSDLPHIYECLLMYSILGEIMLDPNFTRETLTSYSYAFLAFWIERVQYHYDQYNLAKPDSSEAMKHAQYMHDLFWDMSDNPYSEYDVLAAMISMVTQMSCTNHISENLNEATDIISKEECQAYMQKVLDLPSESYLLPASLQYPILNKGSIKLAMDIVNSISADDLKEFVTNLNRKYKEFGCTFAITPDHPYAKYADQAIIDHMSMIILENDVGNDDRLTSSDLPSNYWYDIQDVGKKFTKDFLGGHDLGPNTKPMQNPDFVIRQ